MPFTFVRHLVFCSIVACVIAPRAAVAAPNGQDEPPLEYRTIVAAYRAGDTAGALAELQRLARGDLRDAVQRLAGLADAESRVGGELSIDPALVRAAAVLHADAAAEAWTRQDAERAGRHIASGELLIEALAGRRSTAGPFIRRWYLATALITARHAGPEATLDYFDRITKEVPGDAALLTAAGWFAERLSFARAVEPRRWLTVARSIPDVRRQQEEVRRRHQRRAIQWFTAALEAHPGAPGATVRLARLEASRGRDQQARALLAPLVARDDVPRLVAYVARLLLGNVCERSGQAGEAERLYGEAIALAPPGQSARLALARLKYAADPDTAAEAVAGFLSSATDVPGSDPWADYQLAYLPLGTLLLDELRLEVRR